MVTVYTTLIIEGLKKLEEVPEILKEEVRKQLTALGLDGEGKPLTTD